MPIYEYKCRDCERTFEVLTKMDKRDNVKCPGCQSANIQALFSSFSTKSFADKVGPPACQGCSNTHCSNYPR
ncbi:MAG: FmdB family zinc ribbon protein [Syntrophomonadaceae bacterium]